MHSFQSARIKGKLALVLRLAPLLAVLASSVRILADDEVDQTNTTVENSAHAALVHKLRTLIIDEIYLHNATPKEALKVLSDECIKSDPEHRGISFIGQFRQEDSQVRISINLENVSVKEALKHLFPYAVGNTVVCVGYRHDHGEGLIVRTFTLPNGLFLLGSNQATDSQKKGYDVKQQFEARGVEFAPGMSAIYTPENNQLTVVAVNGDQLNLIDEILNP